MDDPPIDGGYPIHDAHDGRISQSPQTDGGNRVMNQLLQSREDDRGREEPPNSPLAAWITAFNLDDRPVEESGIGAPLHHASRAIP